MAEGFDDFESGEWEYKDYTRDQLVDEYNHTADEWLSIDIPHEVRVRYNDVRRRMREIEYEDFRRQDEEGKTSFIDDGKTVTIKGDPYEETKWIMARNLVTSTYCASASVGPESAKIQQHLYRDLLILVNISFLTCNYI